MPGKPFDVASREPVDTDVDLRPARPARHRADEARVLAVVAVGGALGAAARYGLGIARPTTAGGFPWVTLGINVLGCALIGVLMVLVTDVWAQRRLLRPFLGTGVLGGFTTFSTYAVEAQRLLSGGRIITAVAYLVATVVGALAAVWLTATLTRRAFSRRQR